MRAIDLDNPGLLEIAGLLVLAVGIVYAVIVPAVESLVWMCRLRAIRRTVRRSADEALYADPGRPRVSPLAARARVRDEGERVRALSRVLEMPAPHTRLARPDETIDARFIRLRGELASEGLILDDLHTEEL